MYTKPLAKNHPTLSIIAAIAQKNRAIGKDNKLLWHIPQDLTRFKDITNGHPIIMGRKTYESIGRPLPNRTNIVISHNSGLQIEGCVVVHSFEEAIAHASTIDSQEIFIIGGAQIYKKGIDIADRLYLTLVEGDFEGDAFFPDYSAFRTVLNTEKRLEKGYSFTFMTLAK